MTSIEKIIKNALDRLLKQQEEVMSELNKSLSKLENEQLKNLLEKSLDTLK